jgi:hypothetical protein
MTLLSCFDSRTATEHDHVVELADTRRSTCETMYDGSNGQRSCPRVADSWVTIVVSAWCPGPNMRLAVIAGDVGRGSKSGLAAHPPEC